MALSPADNELFASETRAAVHGIHSRRNRTVQFSTGTVLLAIGQVVSQYDDGELTFTPGHWAPYLHTDLDGLQIPRGIIVVDTVQLNASNEVLGVVMMEGEVNVSDLNFDGSASVLANFLLTQKFGGAGTVSPTFRELGITITGASGIG